MPWAGREGLEDQQIENAREQVRGGGLSHRTAAVALHYMHYNFARIHKTLRITPPMAAGIADHVGSFGEIVALLDSEPVRPSRMKTTAHANPVELAYRLIFAVGLLSLLVAVPTAQVYTPGRGVSSPEVVTKVRAEYTQEARDARIEGQAVLEGVVQTDGTVSDVKVVRSLDSVHGLDDQAMNALKQWRFKPGTKDGKPVAVRLIFHFGFVLPRL